MYLIFMVFIFATQFSNSCQIIFKNEKIFDNSHEEIEDMLSNLISVYTEKNCYKKDRAYLVRILKSEQKPINVYKNIE